VGAGAAVGAAGFGDRRCPAARVFPDFVAQQAEHQSHHEVLLRRLALGNEQRQGRRRRVGQPWLAVGANEQPMAAQAFEEQQRADALVAVGEGMVLHDEVQQVRGALLGGAVERLAVEGLLDGASTPAWPKRAAAR